MDEKKVSPAVKDIVAMYNENEDAEPPLSTKLKWGNGNTTEVTCSEAKLKALLLYAFIGK